MGNRVGGKWGHFSARAVRMLRFKLGQCESSIMRLAWVGAAMQITHVLWSTKALGLAQPSRPGTAQRKSLRSLGVPRQMNRAVS